MRLGRRGFGVGAIALGAAATSYFIRPANDLVSLFRTIFGAETEKMVAAQRFLADYEQRIDDGTADPSGQAVALVFLTSTNFIEHREQGAELTYDMLYDPYDQPCANVLSANYAPPGEHA